jgi:hypothetical protein
LRRKDVIDLTLENVRRNEPPRALRLNVASLDWIECAKGEKSAVLTSRYDYVVAADVIYDDELTKALMLTLLYVALGLWPVLHK